MKKITTVIIINTILLPLIENIYVLFSMNNADIICTKFFLFISKLVTPLFVIYIELIDIFTENVK